MRHSSQKCIHLSIINNKKMQTKLMEMNGKHTLHFFMRFDAWLKIYTFFDFHGSYILAAWNNLLFNNCSRFDAHAFLLSTNHLSWCIFKPLLLSMWYFFLFTLYHVTSSFAPVIITSTVRACLTIKCNYEPW